MKKLYHKLKNSPVLIVLFLVLVFFTPQNLAKSAENVRNAIITTVGVDKDGDVFEVSLLSFIPKAAKEFIQIYEVTSTKANSLSEAFNKAELQLGKDVKLFHTEMAVLGSGILTEDISKVLDFFAREESISSSCILIGTNKTAKEFLEFLQKQDENPSNKLSEVMIYNSNNIYAKETSIESFYNGYYSPVKTSEMAYLTLSDSDNGIILSNPSGSGSSASGDEKQSKQQIKNDGGIILFKEGKMIDVLDNRFLEGVNWINPKDRKENIVIKNFSDEEVKNANIAYYLDEKDVIKTVSFQNNIPVYTASIRIHIDRIEIFGEKEEDGTNIQLINLTEKAKRRIQYEIKSQFANSINTLRKHNADVIGIYREFYTKDRQRFLNFLNSLENKEEYLNNIIFEVYVEIITD